MILWAGTSAGHEALLGLFKANAEFLALTAKQMASDDDCDDEFGGFEPAETIQCIKDVAIITIKGQLVTEESWWTRALQIPSYQGIRNALSEVAEMATNKAITKCVLAIDSPGGYVDGMHACRKFIGEVDKKFVPVYAATAADMMSAAYNIAADTRKIYGDEGAKIGSIGIIAIHTEYVDMFKQMGINKTVLRSAPFKALGTPYERFDGLAKSEKLEEIAKAHNKFVQAVSEGRNIKLEFVANNIANGKVFDEVEAQALRMIDGVQSLEKLVGSLITPDPKPGTVPSYVPRASTEIVPMTTTTSKKRRAVALPAAALAALALGHVPAGANLLATEEEEEVVQTPEEIAAAAAASKTPPVVPAVVTPVVVPAAETPVVAAVPATVVPVAEPVPAPVVAAPSGDAATVALLREQLTGAQTALTQATVTSATQIANLTTERDTAKAAITAAGELATALELPVREACQRLAISLSMTVMGLEDLHGTNLVAQYTKLNEEFNKRFVVGQQSRTDAKAVKTASGESNVTSIQKRGLAATGLK